MKKPQVPHEVVVAALRTACHSFEDANARWAGHIKSGMSDDQIVAALGREFGIWGGSGVYGLGDNGPRCEWWQNHNGGANPSIEIYRFAEMSGDKARLTIHGKRLINVTREVFKIPFPDGPLQLDLF